MPRKARRDDAPSGGAYTAELPSVFDSDPVRWAEVDATVLRACLDAATSQGHAAMFSRSSDGGTLVVTFLIGGARPVKYFKKGEEADAFMREYTEYLIANAGS